MKALWCDRANAPVLLFPPGHEHGSLLGLRKLIADRPLIVPYARAETEASD